MVKRPMATPIQKRERLNTDIFEPFTPPTNAERLLAYYRKRAMYETIEPAQVKAAKC